MINILLASGEVDRFSEMMSAFTDLSVTVNHVPSGASALEAVNDADPNGTVLIVDDRLKDMTGKDLIVKTIAQNPFIQCVAVSTLSHEDFHEEYEGMGVLMQFPPAPTAEDAQNLLDHLAKIASLSIRH